MPNLYDEQLKSLLPHLQAHPCYFPHIGKNYEASKTRLIIVAESHYLHKKFDHKFSAEEWYSKPDYIYSLIDKFKSSITTRAVLEDYLTAPKLIKPYTIFRNLENAYGKQFKKNRLFEECIYINYFQRPSQKHGDSINIHPLDSQISLNNLLALNTILQPNKIIFVSNLAFSNYANTVTKTQKETLPFVFCVPHPASAWWNKTSYKYGLNKDGKPVTGREKFERIIK